MTSIRLNFKSSTSARLIIWLVSLILLFASTQTSARTISSEWQYGQPGTSPHPKLKWGKLENGLRYLILPYGLNKNHLSLRLYMQTGSLHERENEKGYAHFVEHMAFQGGVDFMPREIFETLKTLGMRPGADTNAYVDGISTVYHLEIPHSGRAWKEHGLNFFRNVIRYLVFPPDRINAEKGIIESERRFRNTKETRFADAEKALLLSPAFSGNWQPMGESKTIESVTRAAIDNFYRRTYSPERAIIIAVGDIDADELLHSIKKTMDFSADETASSDADISIATERSDAVPIKIHKESEYSPTLTLYSGSNNYQDNKDQRKRIIKRLLMYLLNNRMRELAVTKPDTVLDAGTNEFYWPVLGAHQKIYVSHTRGNSQDALQQSLRVIRDIEQNGFRDTEIERVKKDYKRDLHSYVSSVKRYGAAAVANHIVQTLKRGIVYESPQELATALLKQLPGIDAQDIAVEFNQLWLQQTPYVLAMTTPNDNISSDELAAVVESSTGTIVTSLVERESNDSFVFKPANKLAAISSKKKNNHIGSTIYRLSNNVRIAARKHANSPEHVVAAVRFGEGRSKPASGISGIQLLAAMAFVNGGLQGYPFESQQRFMLAKDIKLGLSVEDDAFVLWGSAPRNALQPLLQLMASYFIRPAFHTSANAYYQSRLDATYRSIQGSAEGVLSNKVQKALHNNHKNYGFPDLKVAGKRTIRELKNWLKPDLLNSAIRVAVSGGFDETVLETAIESSFTSLNKRPNKLDKNKTKTAFSQNKNLRRYYYNDNSGSDKAVLQYYWLTNETAFDRDDTYLRVLSRILAARISASVREKFGASYGPNAWSNTGFRRGATGYFVTSLDAPVARIEELNAEVKRIVRDIYKKGVTRQEVDSAKYQVVEDLQQSFSPALNWLWLMLISIDDKSVVSRFAKITNTVYLAKAKRINQLAKKYLNPDNALSIAVLPKD